MMLETLSRHRRQFLAPLDSLDADGRRQARTLGIVLGIMIGITLLAYLNVFVAQDKLFVVATVSLMLISEIVSLYILRSGQIRQAAILLIASLWSTRVILALFSGGVNSISFIGLLMVIIIAGLLLGGRTGIFVAVLNILVGLGMLAFQNTASLPEPLVMLSPSNFLISISGFFLGSAGLIYLVTGNLKEAAEQARRYAEAAENNALRLEQMRSSLEEQITLRTQELEQRTDYLQASIEVSRATTSLVEIDSILQNSVEVILQQFDLYYAGLFLVDPGKEWAILRAGTGPAGQAMLERGHRIRIGSGMVGWCIANAQARLAAEADQDLVRLATAELPETRSEAAIPMRSLGKVTGALSVQSRKPQAFGDMELSIFQSIADQLAIALENARLLHESRQALQEVQQAYGRVSQQAWAAFFRSLDSSHQSYRYHLGDEGMTRRPAFEPANRGITWEAEARQAMQEGQPVQLITPHSATLLLPIPIRNQNMGVIRFTKDIESPASGEGVPTRSVGTRVIEDSSALHISWTNDEISLLQTIVEQLGIALDSARLYQDTQRLASRERLASEVTARIRQTLDIQTVLSTAVQEMMRTLNLPEVEITLQPPEESER